MKTIMDKRYADIPAEMFEPVNQNKQLSDLKMETKPIGYLKDAWRRFKKNKGAVVAGAIIVILVLFAIIAPFCSPYQMDQADGYYKQVRPKVPSQNNTGSGFWDGTYVKNQPFQDYINHTGIAIGAMYGSDEPYSWEAVENSEYNPVKKLLDSYTQELSINGQLVKEDRFEYRIDSYYEVGFISVEGLTMEEYERILAWEQETGKKVLYPIVDVDNKDYFNKSNKNEVYQYNYWYKHNEQNYPIDEYGNVLTLEQIKENGLSPNYAYGYNLDPNGEYVVSKTEGYLKISDLTQAELLAVLDKKSLFKKDSKGEYAYKNGEYVLASTLTPEEQATNTDRYKMNYVLQTGKDGEYVFDGDQYKKASSLTPEQLKTAYPRYSVEYVLDPNGKYACDNGVYGTAKDLGWSITDFMAAEKYSPVYTYAADGQYVSTAKDKYVLASSLSETQRDALVRYYNLEWLDDIKGTHVVVDGEYVSIAGKTVEEQIEMIPRFTKELMMYKRTGAGGKNLTVRVLYYNYYQYLNGMEPMFIFGADSQGYDILVRMAQGARLSLILALCVAIINLVIGAIYGAIEGYYGGKIDMFMERVTDVLSGIPTIVLVTLFRLHFVDTGKVSALGGLILALIVTGWIGTAYAVRMQFYRFKGQEYVLAARTLGAKDARLMFRHIFPNSLGTLITSSVLVIPGIIFSESSLAYLGIIDFNGTTMTSLGTMLANGQSAGIDKFPHIIFFPALVLSLLMICFNLFGNGLRDAFNPSLRGSEG